MNSANSVEVLAACKSLLKTLNLCNKKGVRIRNVKIPNLVVFGAFLAPIFYELTMTVWKCITEDVEEQQMSNLMCVIMSNLQGILTHASMVNTNQFTIETIDHMQEIIDKRCEMNVESKAIYRECEEKSARLVNIVWKSGIVFLVVVFSVSMSFPIGYALFGYPPPHLWLLPIPSKTWLDKETYFGFTVCLIVQLCAYVPWTLAFVAPLMLYMGLCSYIVAHATDLKTIFTKLDDQVLLNKYASKKTTATPHVIDPNSILREILKEAVNSHRDLIKMMENTRRTVSGYLFYQFIFTLNYIAYFIFAMDGVQAKSIDFNVLIVYNFLVTSICLNFILCYYADNLTEEASGVADAMYNTAWFEMPVEQQKLLLLPICRSQKLIRLTGFGVYTYSLQNFARIVLRSQCIRLFIFSLTGRKTPQLMLYDNS